MDIKSVACGFVGAVLIGLLFRYRQKTVPILAIAVAISAIGFSGYGAVFVMRNPGSIVACKKFGGYYLAIRKEPNPCFVGYRKYLIKPEELELWGPGVMIPINQGHPDFIGDWTKDQGENLLKDPPKIVDYLTD